MEEENIKEEVDASNTLLALRPRKYGAASTESYPDVPVTTIAKRMVLIAVALVTGFYIYKSVTSNGVEVTHYGVVHTRTIFAWIDISLAVIAAYLIIRYSRSLIS